MVQRFNSAFKHILLLDTLVALGAASIEEVLNVLQQLQNEAFEEEEKQQQQQISNEQFQELLNGINFDEPIEETKILSQSTQNQSKEQTLMNLQKKKYKKKNKINPTPILAPFCSIEEKETGQ